MEDKPVVIGYDRRFLSKEAVIWSCEIFGQQGIKVLFVDRSSPTPLIMFYVMKHDLSYGMMVTATHNPAIYNGIKVFTKGGRDADEHQTADIERYLEQADKLYVPDLEENGQMPPHAYQESVKSGQVVEMNPMNEYLDNIISLINLDAIRERGSAHSHRPNVRREPDGALHHSFYCKMYGGDHQRPKMTRCLAVKCRPRPRARCAICKTMYWTDTVISALPPTETQTVLGVIDDKGHYLHANTILVMLYYYLLKYRGRRGPSGATFPPPMYLDKVAESFGQKCYEVPVGFKYISAKMQETDAIIGGEICAV